MFLERICAIEDYFNVQISLRGEITDNEYNTVVYISDLIRNDLVIGTWSEVTFTGSLSQHFREKLTTLDIGAVRKQRKAAALQPGSESPVLPGAASPHLTFGRWRLE